MKTPLVLVVDDDKVVHLVMAQILKDFDCTALYCDNGAKALELAREQRPDLVITDALLPGLDGRELARALKSSPETAHCKVAVITGLYKGVRYRSEALNRFSVDEYLEKPLKVDQIRALIASVTSVYEPNFALVG
jgi:putative two-component system response regulator